MAFQNPKSSRFDFGKTEVVAKAFTLSDGTPLASSAAATTSTAGVVKQSATVAAVASANAGATYTAAEQTLINELKTQVNLLIANLKTAGVVA